MRIYKEESVFDAALDRIRWLFDEFPEVIVDVSGGKDSTVVFHLSLQVAREKNRLPLKVMWLDQEAEWQATVDMVQSLMYHPDVAPRWYQIPMVLFNATSASDHWLRCWDPAREADWMHPKDPVAVTENVYGTNRFAKLFDSIIRVEYPETPCVHIAGVRAEESPNRSTGLTWDATYKWATWGRCIDRRRGHYTMYPVYDWMTSDVWKAIHDNGWAYNRIYDAMYRYGLPIHLMRVSNVHHETAVQALFYMEELEPETWERLTARLAGVDMASKMGKLDYMPKELPFMFASWREYRDYLLPRLIDNPDWRSRMQKMFASLDRSFGPDHNQRAAVRAILLNDWEGVTIGNALSNNAGPGRKAHKRAYDVERSSSERDVGAAREG